MRMEYYKNLLTGDVHSYDEEQIAAGFVAAGLVKMTDTEIELHLNPPVTPEELQLQAGEERIRLRAIADTEIDWRQDAVDADIATDEEKSALSAWRKYRVLLMRVDTVAPVWPTVPEV